MSLNNSWLKQYKNVTKALIILLNMHILNILILLHEDDFTGGWIPKSLFSLRHTNCTYTLNLHQIESCFLNIIMNKQLHIIY